MSFTAWVIPLFLSFVLLFGMAKKVPVFSVFLEGAREGIASGLKVMPAFVGIMVAIGMFRASGALDLFVSLLQGAASHIGIPEACLPLALMRPISGSGALVLLEEVLRTAGPDSFAGRVASVLMGSTETTFYTIAVYYGSVGVKKTGSTLPAALSGDIAGFLLSAAVVRLFFH